MDKPDSDNDNPVSSNIQFERGGHRLPDKTISFRKCDQIILPNGQIAKKSEDFHKETSFSPEHYPLVIHSLSRLAVIANEEIDFETGRKSLLASYIEDEFFQQGSPRSFYIAICKGISMLIEESANRNPESKNILRDILLTQDGGDGLDLFMIRHKAHHFLSNALKDDFELTLPDISLFIGLHSTDNVVKQYEVVCPGTTFARALFRCTHEAAKNIAYKLKNDKFINPDLVEDMDAALYLQMIAGDFANENEFYDIRDLHWQKDLMLSEYIREFLGEQ